MPLQRWQLCQAATIANCLIQACTVDCCKVVAYKCETTHLAAAATRHLFVWQSTGVAHAHARLHLQEMANSSSVFLLQGTEVLLDLLCQSIQLAPATHQTAVLSAPHLGDIVVQDMSDYSRNTAFALIVQALSQRTDIPTLAHMS